MSDPVDCVTSELWRECARTVVDGARAGRTLAGLAVLALEGTGGGGLVGADCGGDFARMVLGWLLVVEVRSVISASPSRMLDFEMLGVSRELSTLCLPDAISRCSESAFLRMLFALAVFLRSAPMVAASGGLGGGLVGRGGESCFCASTSVASDTAGSSRL